MFAYFDGDNIGNHLELLLLDNRIDEAKTYSESVNRALSKVRKLLEDNPAVDVLLAGGDDLIARWQSDSILILSETVESARETFEEACGKSLSVGIGRSSSRAAINLRRAKLMGKARTVCDVESWNGTEA